jgi:hypothetical protein
MVTHGQIRHAADESCGLASLVDELAACPALDLALAPLPSGLPQWPFLERSCTFGSHREANSMLVVCGRNDFSPGSTDAH